VIKIRWGRLWGTMSTEKGFKKQTLWGGEADDGVAALAGVKLNVVSIRGVIKPCDSCKRISRCAMYQSFTRHRLRHGEYNQGTNILFTCDMYIPNSMPGDIRAPMIHGRTSGQDPT